MSHIQVQDWKKCIVVSLKYTSVTRSSLYMLFNYSEHKSKEQIAVHDSDTPVTLKQGQGHQTWYELVDPKQG